jgi:hypothetical protein
MTWKEWFSFPGTRILRYREALHSTALTLLAAKVAKEAGTTEEEVRRYWLKQAEETPIVKEALDGPNPY